MKLPARTMEVGGRVSDIGTPSYAREEHGKRMPNETQLRSLRKASIDLVLLNTTTDRNDKVKPHLSVQAYRPQSAWSLVNQRVARPTLDI